MNTSIEIGHFCVILALVLSVIQLVTLIIGNWKSWPQWVDLGVIITPSVFFLILVGFSIVLLAFVRSDFSLLLVAEHSHSLKPFLYKITGIWGNHEGSMLLWILCLSFYSFLIFVFRKKYSLDFLSFLFASQSIIVSTFLCFLIFASNPFVRVLDPPVEGMGLNPVLQDLALALHPPVLYLGYVGLCVTYSFAFAGMVTGSINSKWATQLRPWTLISWIFLTVGIALGSWWAYYELGWGGFWFWDPVENSALMPWLAATALIHSNNVLIKRNIFRGWTVLLALFAFTFSLIGTFIVRSGIIASVHAFAVDPERGIYLLLIILMVFSLGLALYIRRAGSLSSYAFFTIYSRESSLVLNNLLLCVSATIIFLGTIWPFLIEFFVNEQISVGAPFFNLSLAPFAFLIALFLPLGARMGWKRGSLQKSIVSLLMNIFLTLVFTLLFIFISKQASIFLVTGIALAFWVIFGSMSDLVVRFGTISPFNLKILFRRTMLNKIELGKNISHLGVGFIILGITAVSCLETEIIKEVKVGDNFRVGQYDVSFNGVKRRSGQNFISDVASLSVISDDKEFILAPEKRFYFTREVITSEVAIKKFLSSDVYAVLGDLRTSENSNDEYWILRIYIKPLINCIWLGSLMIGFGGVVSLLNKNRHFT